MDSLHHVPNDADAAACAIHPMDIRILGSSRDSAGQIRAIRQLRRARRSGGLHAVRFRAHVVSIVGGIKDQRIADAQPLTRIGFSEINDRRKSRMYLGTRRDRSHPDLERRMPMASNCSRLRWRLAVADLCKSARGHSAPPAHPSIPSSSFIPRWISSSSFASSARISFGGRCSTSSCTTSL